MLPAAQNSFLQVWLQGDHSCKVISAPPARSKTGSYGEALQCASLSIQYTGIQDIHHKIILNNSGNIQTPVTLMFKASNLVN